MRVRTPWIEALRNQQAEGKQAVEPSGKPEVPKDRNMQAKHMNDSYHSVVLPLARDPWLLDTYLNSSGHIRLGTIFMDLDALSGIIACKPHSLCETGRGLSKDRQTHRRRCDHGDCKL